MSTTTKMMQMAEWEYVAAEDRWQSASPGTVDESEATIELISALRTMVAEQQRQIDAITTRLNRFFEAAS